VSKRGGAASEGGAAAIRRALGEVCGAALVLDADLRIALCTEAAEALLGFEVPLGESAARVLCGDATKRPVAEALAAGRPVQAVLPRPRAGAESQLVRLRATPLKSPGEARPSGFLLFLEEAAGALAEGEVCFQGMWTQDPQMKQLFRVIERVADSDTTVLVRGETGAGKELVANALHALSPRRHGPLRALNCAALPAHLLESELFGHARGAFTGALRDTPGHIQLAHGGTLFLDEVAELPLELQAKLLRVLETRAVLPVGAREPVPVDVRVISATHRGLRREVEAGRFRADLMYRLRVIPLYLPPLRARPGDVLLLCAKRMEELNARGRRRIEGIAPAAERALRAYDWPGNVRELRNVLEYAYAIGEGPVLGLMDLPPEVVDPSLSGEGEVRAETPRPAATEAASSPEAARILRALERSAGNRERAAQILGVSRVTLWRRMRALGLSEGEELG
jgi:transcriptional regulator with PAS, ATPase and Fis domain